MWSDVFRALQGAQQSLQGRQWTSYTPPKHENLNQMERGPGECEGAVLCMFTVASFHSTDELGIGRNGLRKALTPPRLARAQLAAVRAVDSLKPLAKNAERFMLII
jgi:hypothetical protein